jgi:hypothetical protein
VLSLAPTLPLGGLRLLADRSLDERSYPHYANSARCHSLRNIRVGQTQKNSVRANVFRITLESGHRSMQSTCLKGAQEETFRVEVISVVRSPRRRLRAASAAPLSHGARSSVGCWRIRLLPVSGGTIRRNRCGRGALRPTARASAPRPGRPSIGPQGRSRPHAGRRPPSDSGR